MIGTIGLEQRITRGLSDLRLIKLGGVARKTLKPWVARIVGRDSHYGYQRTFLRAKRDYTDSNRRGTRGVMLWYTLDHGHYYEVCEWFNTAVTERYFVRVDDTGEVVRVPQEEVDTWLGP